MEHFVSVVGRRFETGLLVCAFRGLLVYCKSIHAVVQTDFCLFQYFPLDQIDALHPER